MTSLTRLSEYNYAEEPVPEQGWMGLLINKTPLR